MRQTQTHQRILDLLKPHTLLTAHELCQSLEDLNRATIYRNLASLVKSGAIRELSIHKAVTSYERVITNDEHLHLICDQCHQVEAIHLDSKKLVKLLPKNIHISDIEINIKGQCSHCKQS